MSTETDESSSLALLRRLEKATNGHDLDALVDCFSSEYVNETPAHPARGFRGKEQVRRNWQTIFGAVPDLSAVVVRSVADGGTVWSEWEMSGSRRDGVPHLMRGVIILGVEEGVAAWARFYLEPVQSAGGDVDDAVRSAVGVRS